MNPTRLLLYVAVVFCFSNCQKSESKIDDIEFTYISGLRIPYNTVNVSISTNNDKKSAFAFIHSVPSSNDSEWAYSKIDTIIEIDIKSFEKLAEAAKNLENINPDKAYNEGLDGSTWKIEFGSKGKNKSYKFWSPKFDTEKRGLTEFVNLSEQILEKVNLNRKEILD
jgi:hypothetical protein